MYAKEDIFNRNELLLGSEVMREISQTRIILFGVGGVGSWCAESLIRSGIGHLTLVDFDRICTTNINRQLPATTETVGLVKAEVLRERLKTINPYANIRAIQSLYSAETAESFELNRFDYILDAIDSLQHKAHLIVTATQTNATLFSSMGAALKLNPARIQTAEFWKVQGCPLAAALRRRLKQQNTLPAQKFQCVYSDEVLRKTEPPTSSISSTQQTSDASTRNEQKGQINGTIAHTTAIFGFTLAGLVIQDLVEKFRPAGRI